jgi:hypothetical protein
MQNLTDEDEGKMKNREGIDREETEKRQTALEINEADPSINEVFPNQRLKKRHPLLLLFGITYVKHNLRKSF